MTIFGRVRIRGSERSTRAAEQSESIANRGACWRPPVDFRAQWEQQL